MTTTPTKPTTDVLTDDMLARFDERAPQYDRENRFFHEDFEELRAAGYLKIALPEAASWRAECPDTVIVTSSATWDAAVAGWRATH